MGRDPFEPDPSVEAPAFVKLEEETRADRLAADLWGGTLFFLFVVFSPLAVPFWILGRVTRKLRAKLWEGP